MKVAMVATVNSTAARRNDSANEYRIPGTVALAARYQKQ